MKVVEPVASSSTSVTCRARPPRVAATEPREGVVVAVAVRTSPSASESFCSTGRVVVRPGRTPKESSTASGGVFCSLRWGSAIWSVCSGESSWSSFSASCFSTSSQSSMRTMFSSGSHTEPELMSFRTIRVRLVRNTSWLLAAMRVSTTMAVEAPGSSHTRW